MGKYILGVMLIIVFTWLCYMTWKLRRLVNELLEQYETLCILSAAQKIEHRRAEELVIQRIKDEKGIARRL